MVGRMKYIAKDAKKVGDDEKQDLTLDMHPNQRMCETSCMCLSCKVQG